MLWLGLSFPDLPASALGLHDPLDAVVDRHGAQRWLIVAAGGSAAGTALNAALAREPKLRVHGRRPAAERAALRQLAHWLHRYGSPVGCGIVDLAERGFVPRARLWVEVGASLKLFGGIPPLRRQLFGELAELGHRARCALAPSRAGAALLAEIGAQDPCGDGPALRAALANLPIRDLPWPAGVLHALAGVGLTRLGELFALPRESFARRFGEERLLDLDRLLGEAADPFAPVVLPPRFARRFELSGEIETVEPLLFPLKRLCAELAAYLRARDSGACSLRIAFAHARGAPTVLTLRFLAPTRDAARMFALLQERLLRAPPEQPVRELQIDTGDFAAPQALQGDLFDAARGSTLAWEQALEKLQGRLGEDALWTPACVADHRPEKAHAAAGRAAARQDRAAGGGAIGAKAPRPLWLLPQPQLLPRAPQIVDDAESIESGWWDGADVRRRYHSARAADGARLWVYQDAADGRWYLHGLWA